MHVIVTDCHYRGVLSLIRELHSCGHEVTAVCERGKPPLGLHCRQTNNKRLFPKRLSETEYAEQLMDVCEQRRGSILLPFGARTIGVLSRRQELFRRIARFLVPAPGVLETAGDRLLVSRMAQKLGIPTPWIIRFQTAEPVEQLASQLSYPVVLRYRNGEKLGLTADRRCTVAASAKEFTRRYETMHEVQPPVIVQEYIPGKSLCVCVLMDEQHQPVRVFCYERLREYPVTGGPSSACRSDWFPALAETAVRLLGALRYTGFARCEFKGTPDDAKLLGIVPRIWGSFPLSVHSGAGMADAYVETLYGVPPPQSLSCSYRTDVKMQYLTSDLHAAFDYIRHGQAGQVRRVLRDAFSKEVRGGVFSRRDLGGSLFCLMRFSAATKN